MTKLPLLLALAIALAPASPRADVWEYFFGETPPPKALQEELEAFDDSRQSLRDTIDRTVRTLSEVSEYDLKAAEREAEAIRTEIEGVLDSLEREGALGSAATGAYRWMLAQRERVRGRGDLTAAQKALLLSEWDTQIAEVERVLDELRDVQARLLAQLRVVSGHEGFLEELLILGKARVATETLKGVLGEFRAIVAAFEDLGVEYVAPTN